ncbi:MAG: hypothetical protein CMK64_05165 [Pseudoalteromonas sp.]|nr:hypothetical protein [Pseudoalteromonas sp.]|tara:strand:- start:43086 stop:44450 length:1365 start_codon:yes stop_codon:yes gene_type:complete
MRLKNNPSLALGAIVAVVIVLSLSFSSDEETIIQKKEENTTKVYVKDKDDAASDNAAEVRSALSSQIQQLQTQLQVMQTQLNDFEKKHQSLSSVVEAQDEGEMHYQIATDNESLLVRDPNNPNVNQPFSSTVSTLEDSEEKTPLVSIDGVPNYKYDNGTSDYAESDDPILWIGEDKGFLEPLKSVIGGGSPIDFSSQSQKKSEPTGVVPYATIDPEAILLDAFVYDVLIGISPNQTGLIEPYKFKLELSNENLMTSGIKLPEIEKMRMSGYAVGEWSTSCVRGYITSATFVFNDGRIFSVGSSSGEGKNPEHLAYITDSYGSPCLAGKKYSSLLEYASIHGSLKALSSIGEGISNAQFTNVEGANGFEQVFTGDQTKLALGSGLSGGFDAISQTVAARYANVRDLVVAKHESVIVQLTKAIEIDYDANGRKILNTDFNEELEKYYEYRDSLNNN